MENNSNLKLKVLEKALNIIGCHIYWKDQNGKFVWCNTKLAESLGLRNKEEIKDKTDYELYSHNIAKQVVELDNRVLSSGKEHQIEESGLDKNGNSAIYLSTKTPLHDDLGNVTGLIGISIDISDRKKAERAKQEFLQNMAHDIRTPLAGIIGVSELFEKGLIEFEETNSFGKMLLDAGNQLLELLNQVIETIDTDHMSDPIKQEPLHLLGLAEELRVLFQPNLITKPLTLDLDVDPNLPVVLTDRIKLKRVLINLLSNAIKFTEKGKITFSIQLISIKNQHAQIEIKIKDTGIGIAPDKLDQIFDRFYRVHPTYIPEYSGYGIGLYAVKQTLQVLNGQIHAASQLGQGSCFTLHFNFPLAHPITSQSETIHTSEINSPNPIEKSPNRTILIAEDNPIVCSIIKRTLIDAGYDVVATHDGKTALAALKQQSFKWALLDIGMPELSGTEVCKQYRQWEKENNKTYLPIFALTGHSVDEVKDECHSMGIDQVFTKPLTEIMIQEIENWITKKA